MKDRILEIVRTRGKMHNPETNSGGVLLGVVQEIGEAAKESFKLKVISAESELNCHIELKSSGGFHIEIYCCISDTLKANILNSLKF